MSYKHSELAEKLLQQAQIAFEIPTAGHYMVYKADHSDRVVWFPKSNTLRLFNANGSQGKLLRDFNTREQTIVYIQTWLKEETNGV